MVAIFGNHFVLKYYVIPFDLHTQCVNFQTSALRFLYDQNKCLGSVQKKHLQNFA